MAPEFIGPPVQPDPRYMHRVPLDDPALIIGEQHVIQESTDIYEFSLATRDISLPLNKKIHIPIQPSRDVAKPVTHLTQVYHHQILTPGIDTLLDHVGQTMIKIFPVNADDTRC